MNYSHDKDNAYCAIFLGFFALTIILSASSENYAFATPSIESSNSTNILPINGNTTAITLESIGDVTGTDRLLVVGVTIDHSRIIDETITTVVFGPGGGNCIIGAGRTLTLVPGTTSTSAFSYNQIYSLVSPPVGASTQCDIVVTLTGPVGGLGIGLATAASANYVIFSGVDQTNPIEPSLTVQSTGSSTAPSVSIVTGADHFAYDIMSTASVGLLNPTAGAFQILVDGQAFSVGGGPPSTLFAMGSSTQSGVADGIMSWTLSASAPWDISAIAIRDVSLPAIVSSTSSNNKNGGCGDCTPPTIGLSKSLVRIVDNGFVYNGQSVDVETWHTEFPLINATVGEPNLVEVKIYENNGIFNIKSVQFGIGMKEIGQPLSEAEVIIQVLFLTNGTYNYIAVDEINITDKENLIDNDAVSAVAYAAKCQDSDDVNKCVKVDLNYTYREATFNHVMVVHALDKSRNSQPFWINDGVQVLGESVNIPPTYLMHNKHASQQTENLWLTLTRTDKFQGIWEDQNGIEYQKIYDNEYKRITPVDAYQCNDKPLEEINVPTRLNCHFREQMKHLWFYEQTN